METKSKLVEYLRSRHLEVETIKTSPYLKVYHPMNEFLKLSITINLDNTCDLSLYVRSQHYIDLKSMISYEETRFEICRFEAACVCNLVDEEDAELDNMYEEMKLNCDLGI